MAQQGSGGRNNVPNTSPSTFYKKGSGPKVVNASPPRNSMGTSLTPRSAPSSPTPYSGGPSYDGPTGGYGGGGEMAPAAPAISEEDFLASDQSYIRQMAALKAAMENFLADQTAQTTKYNTDFNEGIRQLGWMGRPEATGADAYDSTGGSWNETDANTASGRAFTNQLNDFASRGLLQSSLFGTARDDLSRSLNDQLKSVVTGRTNFLNDLGRQRTAYQLENESGQRSAREEALARMAALIGV